MAIEVGARFGRLTVLAAVSRGKGGGYSCRVRCDCGVTMPIPGSALLRKHVQSCGCYKRDFYRSLVRHGDMRGGKRTVERIAWEGAIKRCERTWHQSYAAYGGRGIRVCERWRTSYKAFLEDMGRKPSPRHSLDRINNDGNYEPGNCRWATPVEQAHNRRDLKLSEWDVVDIRTLHAFGATYRSLSDAYGVGTDSISRVVTNKTWR